MGPKNSIMLSNDLLKVIDQMVGKTSSRSEFIESILRRYFDERTRKERNLKDLEILNRNSEYLNSEAEDALTYQVGL